MGDVDTFYLEGATRLLKQSLENLGSDAVVEIHAGKDHSSLANRWNRLRLRAAVPETPARPNSVWYVVSIQPTAPGVIGSDEIIKVGGSSTR